MSVIIPTFNRSSTLSRAIGSVLNQTYKNFELLVIDDGSRDNTDEIISKFPDQRLRYIKLHQNRGVAFARNAGIEASYGSYIAFQDSDDEWLTTKLEKQVNILIHSSKDVGLVYTKFIRFMGNAIQIIPRDDVTKRDGDLHNELLKGNFVSAQTVLIKKECLYECGKFDSHCEPWEDWELFLRIAKKYKFKYIDEQLVAAYIQKNSISKNKIMVAQAETNILEKHHEDFKINYPKKLMTFYCSQGYLLRNTNKLGAFKYYIKSLQYGFSLNQLKGLLRLLVPRILLKNRG